MRTRKLHHVPLATAVTGLTAATSAAPRPAIAAEVACAAAYYGISHGSGIDIAPADDGNYCWRWMNGTTGLLIVRRDGTWSSPLRWTG